MALVWQRNSGARLRGTMSGFFLVGSMMSIAALTLTGAIDGRTVWGFAALVPAAVIGYALSRRINRFLDPKRLRWLAIGASTVGAVVLGAVVVWGVSNINFVQQKVDQDIRDAGALAPIEQVDPTGGVEVMGV